MLSIFELGQYIREFLFDFDGAPASGDSGIDTRLVRFWARYRVIKTKLKNQNLLRKQSTLISSAMFLPSAIMCR